MPQNLHKPHGAVAKLFTAHIPLMQVGASTQFPN
jgi:hypothetical protein